MTEQSCPMPNSSNASGPAAAARKLKGHGHPVRCMCVVSQKQGIPQESLLMTWEKTFQLVSLGGGAGQPHLDNPLCRWNSTFNATCVASNASGITWVGYADGSVAVLLPRGGRLTPEKPQVMFNNSPTAITVSDETGEAWIGDSTGRLKVVQPQNYKICHEKYAFDLDVDQPELSAVLSKSRGSVACLLLVGDMAVVGLSCRRSTLSVRSIKKAALQDVFDLKAVQVEPPTCLSQVPEAHRSGAHRSKGSSTNIISGHAAGRVLLWKLEQGKLMVLAQLCKDIGGIRGIVYFPDLPVVVLGHDGGIISLLAIPHILQPLVTSTPGNRPTDWPWHKVVLKVHRYGLVAFCASNSFVITSSYLGTVRAYPHSLLLAEAQKYGFKVRPHYDVLVHTSVGDPSGWGVLRNGAGAPPGVLISGGSDSSGEQGTGERWTVLGPSPAGSGVLGTDPSDMPPTSAHILRTNGSRWILNAEMSALASQVLPASAGQAGWEPGHRAAALPRGVDEPPEVGTAGGRTAARPRPPYSQPLPATSIPLDMPPWTAPSDPSPSLATESAVHNIADFSNLSPSASSALANQSSMLPAVPTPADTQDHLARLLQQTLSPGQIIRYSELGERTEIGQGSYGTVFRAKWQGTEVATKELMNVKSLDDPTAHSFVNEVRMLQRVCHHPNVMRMCGVCLRPPMLVTQYYRMGSLVKLIQDAHQGETKAVKIMSWQKRLVMLHDIATAMIHLHKQGIVHADLRTPNIFLTSDYKIQIGDFGLAREVGEMGWVRMSEPTHPRYRPPEVFREMMWTPAADVWTFGVIMWEMLTWKPATLMTNAHTAQVVLRAYKDPDSLRPRMPTDDDIQGKAGTGLEHYKELMMACLSIDPIERPTFETISSKLSTMRLWHTVNFALVDAAHKRVIMMRTINNMRPSPSLASNQSLSTVSSEADSDMSIIKKARLALPLAARVHAAGAGPSLPPGLPAPQVNMPLRSGAAAQGALPYHQPDLRPFGPKSLIGQESRGVAPEHAVTATGNVTGTVNRNGGDGNGSDREGSGSDKQGGECVDESAGLPAHAGVSPFEHFSPDLGPHPASPLASLTPRSSLQLSGLPPSPFEGWSPTCSPQPSPRHVSSSPDGLTNEARNSSHTGAMSNRNGAAGLGNNATVAAGLASSRNSVTFHPSSVTPSNLASCMLSGSPAAPLANFFSPFHAHMNDLPFSPAGSPLPSPRCSNPSPSPKPHSLSSGPTPFNTNTSDLPHESTTPPSVFDIPSGMTIPSSSPSIPKGLHSSSSSGALHPRHKSSPGAPAMPQPMKHLKERVSSHELVAQSKEPVPLILGVAFAMHLAVPGSCSSEQALEVLKVMASFRMKGEWAGIRPQGNIPPRLHASTPDAFLGADSHARLSSSGDNNSEASTTRGAAETNASALPSSSNTIDEDDTIYPMYPTVDYVQGTSETDPLGFYMEVQPSYCQSWPFQHLTVSDSNAKELSDVCDEAAKNYVAGTSESYGLWGVDTQAPPPSILGPTPATPMADQRGAVGESGLPWLATGAQLIQSDTSKVSDQSMAKQMAHSAQSLQSAHLPSLQSTRSSESPSKQLVQSAQSPSKQSTQAAHSMQSAQLTLGVEGPAFKGPALSTKKKPAPVALPTDASPPVTPTASPSPPPSPFADSSSALAVLLAAKASPRNCSQLPTPERSPQCQLGPAPERSPRLPIPEHSNGLPTSEKSPCGRSGRDRERQAAEPRSTRLPTPEKSPRGNPADWATRLPPDFSPSKQGQNPWGRCTPQGAPQILPKSPRPVPRTPKAAAASCTATVNQSAPAARQNLEDPPAPQPRTSKGPSPHNCSSPRISATTPFLQMSTQALADYSPSRSDMLQAHARTPSPQPSGTLSPPSGTSGVLSPPRSGTGVSPRSGYPANSDGGPMSPTRHPGSQSPQPGSPQPGSLFGTNPRSMRKDVPLGIPHPPGYPSINQHSKVDGDNHARIVSARSGPPNTSPPQHPHPSVTASYPQSFTPAMYGMPFANEPNGISRGGVALVGSNVSNMSNSGVNLINAAVNVGQKLGEHARHLSGGEAAGHVYYPPGQPNGMQWGVAPASQPASVVQGSGEWDLAQGGHESWNGNATPLSPHPPSPFHTITNRQYDLPAPGPHQNESRPASSSTSNPRSPTSYDEARYTSPSPLNYQLLDGNTSTFTTSLSSTPLSPETPHGSPLAAQPSRTASSTPGKLDRCGNMRQGTDVAAAADAAVQEADGGGPTTQPINSTPFSARLQGASDSRQGAGLARALAQPLVAAPESVQQLPPTKSGGSFFSSFKLFGLNKSKRASMDWARR